MLKKIFSITIAACLTTLFLCVNVSADTSIDFGLEFGMTVDEVVSAMGRNYDKIEEVETDYGEHQTLLTYENLTFKGYDCYAILCITPERGFEALNYHIPTDNVYGLYDDFCEELKSACVEYSETDNILSFWYFDDITHFLFNLDNEVQYSIFPSFAEDERGETQQGGNMGISESPETGNTDTASYICVLALAGIAMLVTNRKRS